jgi:hypothetical protein
MTHRRQSGVKNGVFGQIIAPCRRKQVSQRKNGDDPPKKKGRLVSPNRPLKNDN